MGTLIDPRTGVGINEKRSPEDRLYSMDFTSLLEGGTVASVDSVVATNQALVSGSSALTVGATAVSGVFGQVRLSAGENNEDYLVTMTITDSNSNVLVGDGMLQVRDI